jgi:hypothetical protein
MKKSNEANAAGGAHDLAGNSGKQKCYACDRAMKGGRHVVYTADDGGQRQFVGPDCYMHVQAAGPAGYQPPLGGPRLYAAPPAADGACATAQNP